MSQKKIFSGVVIAGGLLAAALWIAPHSMRAAGEAPSPVGAWFGIARPCTPPGGPAHPTVNQTVCSLACNGPCPTSAFPVTEVTMIPTLLADGTVLADDFAAVGVSPPGFPIAGDGHTTAHGKWALQGRNVVVGGNRVDRYQATFIWFQGRPPGFPYNAASPVGFFHGSVRPRFVTFFDKKDKDTMVGFIQPYLYGYTDPDGIVALQPGTPFPTPDPVAPLPAACDPTSFNPAEPYCFGTLQFTIRRIQAE
jgi:hypothetical protein